MNAKTSIPFYVNIIEKHERTHYMTLFSQHSSTSEALIETNLPMQFFKIQSFGGTSFDEIHTH